MPRQRCACGTENPANFWSCVNCGALQPLAVDPDMGPEGSLQPIDKAGCGFLSEIVQHRDAIDEYLAKIRFAVNDLTNLDWQTADELQHIARALRDVAERVTK